MAKIKFTDAENSSISKAIGLAENKTSGEIAVTVIKESYDYAIYETVFAVFGGLLYFIIMMFFVNEIQFLIQSMFWDYSVNYLLIFYGFTTFMVIALLYFLANLTKICSPNCGIETEHS